MIGMQDSLEALKKELLPYSATLVAVSKTKPVEDITRALNLGQLDFGENYVQELLLKKETLPAEINWHFIGHLQTNKIKQLVSFTHLIHGVSSLKAITEIARKASELGRVCDVLLQVHIASEDSKFGFSHEECFKAYESFLNLPLPGIRIRGLMGMASFSDNFQLVQAEFRGLKKLFDEIAKSGCDAAFDTLSMGMSSDYKIALDEGSNMVRIGSLIFGSRK